MSNYYKTELERLNPNDNVNVQFSSDSIDTRWLTLNKDSAEQIIKFLIENYAPRYSLKARLWRDSNGNTYHIVTVYKNGAFLVESGITYGYGTQYKQTARAMLTDFEGEFLNCEVVEVSRKCDL